MNNFVLHIMTDNTGRKALLLHFLKCKKLLGSFKSAQPLQSGGQNLLVLRSRSSESGICYPRVRTRLSQKQLLLVQLLAQQISGHLCL